MRGPLGILEGVLPPGLLSGRRIASLSCSPALCVSLVRALFHQGPPRSANGKSHAAVLGRLPRVSPVDVTGGGCGLVRYGLPMCQQDSIPTDWGGLAPAGVKKPPPWDPLKGPLHIIFFGEPQAPGRNLNLRTTHN